VRDACWMISTDTATVHLADAFGVPCLAFFPTHRPEQRVRDYPRCISVALRSALPTGIEFARDNNDHDLARAAWFPDGNNLQWLDRAIAMAGETFDRLKHWHRPPNAAERNFAMSVASGLEGRE
jgi:hypothetical protein